MRVEVYDLISDNWEQVVSVNELLSLFDLSQLVCNSFLYDLRFFSTIIVLIKLNSFFWKQKIKVASAIVDAVQLTVRRFNERPYWTGKPSLLFTQCLKHLTLQLFQLFFSIEYVIYIYNMFNGGAAWYITFIFHLMLYRFCKTWDETKNFPKNLEQVPIIRKFIHGDYISNIYTLKPHVIYINEIFY